MKQILFVVTLAMISISVAHAAPVGSQTVWQMAGKARYEPGNAVLWGVVRAQDIDGDHVDLGCQSGPFTPHMHDGKIAISNYKQKPNGERKKFFGGYSRRYASNAYECERVLRWFVQKINASPHSQLVLNQVTGDLSVITR